jgi:hypothetical protein
MTALADFLERIDRAKPDPPANYNPEGDQGVIDAAGAMAPYLGRAAERAGIDVDDLADVMWNRMPNVVEIVVQRTVANGAFHVEIWRALRDIAADAFLAGVLWEQERQMPRLEP